jgi:hypothetical protein
VADKHPYISGSGGITAAMNQFKKAFPAKVTADTLKKLGIASNNESYMINILRFIGAIDNDGNRTAEAQSVFSKHEPTEFQKSFGEMLKKAYSDLFSLHGEDAWSLSSDKLISFFRGSDQTSDLVGRRQATTFQILASFAGHGESPALKGSASSKKAAKTIEKVKRSEKKNQTPAKNATTGGALEPTVGRDIGLSVRIEVNLPVAGDQATYDKIFKSIRENLLNAQ